MVSSASTCLAVGEDADIVAVQSRCDQLRNFSKDLLLGALRSEHPVKLKSLHGQHTVTSMQWHGQGVDQKYLGTTPGRGK